MLSLNFSLFQIKNDDCNAFNSSSFQIKTDDEVKELDELRELSESKLFAAEVKEDVSSTTPKAESSPETAKVYLYLFFLIIIISIFIDF